MEDYVYRDMTQFQTQHWWFKARHEILFDIIKNLDLPKPASILEIGCGTGGNLKILQQFGMVCAMETDVSAILHARVFSGITIEQGHLPHDIPDYKKKFDLICLFDVLEHVKNDLQSLIKITEMLSPSGKIILTVPAHMFLYGSHDRAMHHYRRYSKKNLSDIIELSGLAIYKLTYFNAILFPAFLFTRFMDLVFTPKKTMGYDLPNPFINELLYRIFRTEKNIINRHDLPMGASLLLIAGISS